MTESHPAPTFDTPAYQPIIVDSWAKLDRALDTLRADGTAIAVDSERAQRYRYSAKAYLVQMRTSNSPNYLIDPLAFQSKKNGLADLATISHVLADREWIIHAAIQDLPCLVEIGLCPTQLFDTELSGRLLGLSRVNLGAMVQQFCGYTLLKKYSDADWSRRPIPAEWVGYASLDVEFLHQLRDNLDASLVEAGKREWLEQECAYLVEKARKPAASKSEPWRRISGAHQVTTRRGLELVHQLWVVRDHLAHQLDRAPGRLLPDQAIVELASRLTPAHPGIPGRRVLRSIHGFGFRLARRYEKAWWSAMDKVAAMSENQLPPLRLPALGVPAPRTWQRHRPEAWDRWIRVRPAIVERAAELKLPPENLISPKTLRAFLWKPPSEITLDSIREALAADEAREWQIAIISDVLYELLHT